MTTVNDPRNPKTPGATDEPTSPTLPKQPDLDTPRTTGIGSLPHHNVDAALEFAFRAGIPYLPQIPIRNPGEFMIAQALEGLPGLELAPDGSARLNAAVWESRAHAYQAKLDAAFAAAQTGKSIKAAVGGHSKQPRPSDALNVPHEPADLFAQFEPSSSASSGWQPFLWELRERGITYAKVQIAGPMTVPWSLQLVDGSPAERLPRLPAQILGTVLARAIAMVRRVRGQGVRPLIFIDEPGLYGFTADNPRHLLGLQDLKLMIEALRREEAEVGVHCCSRTDWSALLALPLDFLSIDAELSLDDLLSAPHAAPLNRFLGRGGRLSLGVLGARLPAALPEVSEIFIDLLGRFEAAGGWSAERVRECLRRAIFTPACGLALHAPARAEAIAARLHELGRFVAAEVGSA